MVVYLFSNKVMKESGYIFNENHFSKNPIIQISIAKKGLLKGIYFTNTIYLLDPRDCQYCFDVIKVIYSIASLVETIKF